MIRELDVAELDGVAAGRLKEYDAPDNWIFITSSGRDALVNIVTGAVKWLT